MEKNWAFIPFGPHILVTTNLLPHRRQEFSKGTEWKKTDLK